MNQKKFNKLYEMQIKISRLQEQIEEIKIAQLNQGEGSFVDCLLVQNQKNKRISLSKNAFKKALTITKEETTTKLNKLKKEFKNA